jgi:hypothetical protein
MCTACFKPKTTQHFVVLREIIRIQKRLPFSSQFLFPLAP